jgi:hypothetical protein
VKGLYDLAIDTHLKRQTSLEASLEEIAGLKAFYAKHGWKGYWQKQLEYAKQRAERGYYEPYFRVWLYLRLGEKQQALDWLEKAYESRSPWIATIQYDPLLDGLRSDPAFRNCEGASASHRSRNEPVSQVKLRKVRRLASGTK